METDQGPDMSLLDEAEGGKDENILKELMEERENLIKRLEDLQKLVDDELKIEEEDDDDDGPVKKEEESNPNTEYFLSLNLNYHSTQIKK